MAVIGRLFRGRGPADASGSVAARGELLVRRLLTPEIGFPLLWALGVALAQIRLFDFQEQGAWSLRVWVVMFMVPAAFLCGAALGRVGADALRARVRAPAEPSTLQWRQASLVLLAIGVLETVHQLVIAGGIPLLQSDIDRSRFALEGGPSVILTNCAPLAAAIALAAPRRLDPRECKVEFAVAVVGLCAVALLGGRGQVILGIAVLVLLRAYRFGPPSLRFLGSALTAIGLFVAVVFFLRTRQNVAQPFEAELYSDVLPDIPSPLRVLVPLHVAITSNFEALAQVVTNFPDRFAFGHGAYDAHGFDRVIPGSKQVSEVSAQLTSPFVTSTVAGSLWADGGFGWVAGGLALIGALVAGVHRLATRTAALRYMLPAAYLTYLAFFGIYTNLFTQHPDWVVITPLLFLTGAWLDGLRPRPTLQRLASYGVSLARRERLNLKTALRGRRARVLAGLGAVLLVIAAAIVIGGTLGTDPGPAEAPTIVGQPAGTVPTPAGRVLTNGDGALDNEPLWTARRRRTSVTLTEFMPTRDRQWRRKGEVRFPARVGANTQLDVSSWFGETRALFTLRTSERKVDVEVWGANARRVVSAGTANEPSLLDRGTRDVAIATYAGALPDLYIVDRGVANERARLAVYSGESAFRTRILQARLPVVGLAARDWLLDVGRVGARRPDLILLARRGASGGPELHVLSGDTNYRTFRLQHRTQRVTAGAPSETSLRALTVGGFPIGAVINSSGASSRVTTLALGAPAG